TTLHTKRNKPTKLIHKSIQAGNLEIVNSATKRHTRDVGMTFPSPTLQRLESNPSASSQTENITPDPQGLANQKQPSSFFVEKKKSKPAGRQQRPPQSTFWFIPAEDLKSDSRKENRPGGDMGPKLEPAVVWFEPFTKTKPWREPLQEKQLQQPNRCKERGEGQPNLHDSAPNPFVKITLQEALEMCRPDFISSSRERQKRLELLTEQRRTQNIYQNERKQLFNHPEGKTIWYLLQQRRMIPKKEMVMRSKRMYQDLPEVKRRWEEERRKAEYKSYRLKADLYKKKITNRLLGRKAPWE
uniref:ALMS motif domain-containing protein n=1 Tax=Latimeria chalumnae TaxID=7897 RepID=H3A4V4_LATCH